jgi:hypothetical protein
VKLLLDENVPIQALDLLGRVLRGHEISHVDRIRWKGKNAPTCGVLWVPYPTDVAAVPARGGTTSVVLVEWASPLA